MHTRKIGEDSRVPDRTGTLASVTAAQTSPGTADLHMHSNQSDGTDPPADVMLAAHRAGLRTAALTDHDTTAGWAEAADSAASLGMTFVPGMEMSARHEYRSVHLLAYLIDPSDTELRSMTERVRSSRMDRAREFAERIGADYDLTWDDILAQTSEGATVGRPHIADALVAKGHVRDRAEAFRGILSPRGGYYVSLFSPDPVTAVRLVRAAGGVPIIAHPASRAGVLPETVLAAMVDAGLAGFELGHRENLAPGVAQLQKMAIEHNLIVTGSSDFHGRGKPNVPGEFTTTEEMVERILALGKGSAPVFG